MKAAVFHDVGDLTLEEVPDPEMRRDDALIRVRVCGLCGSEFNKYKGSRKATFPFISGHEWCGNIVDVGPEVENFRVGDRVIGETCIPCGTCAVCREGFAAPACLRSECYGMSGTSRPGALAEYIAVKEKALYKIPEDMSYEEGSLVEPLSVSYHAIWGVGGGVAPHDRVVIFGCGPIGLLALMTVKAACALAIVVEPSTYRRDLAGKLGADVLIDPIEEDTARAVTRHTKGRGATLVLECSANENAVASTLHTIGVGARVVVVGVKDGPDVPMRLIETAFKKAQIVGSGGAPFFFPKTLDFMARRSVDFTAIITHRFPLSDIAEAFETGLSGTENGKIVIDCTDIE